jgi:hypothetical protein
MCTCVFLCVFVSSDACVCVCVRIYFCIYVPAFVSVCVFDLCRWRPCTLRALESAVPVVTEQSTQSPSPTPVYVCCVLFLACCVLCLVCCVLCFVCGDRAVCKVTITYTGVCLLCVACCVLCIVCCVLSVVI